MRLQTFILATSAAMAAMVLPPASAQAAGPASADAAEAATVYARDYFDRFAPRTALNIVERVPGFTIDFGDNRRGFEGAGGNVLINGARVPSKSGGLREALERIPASQIDRIEVIVNPTNAAAAGQTVIVNIVLRAAQHGATWQVDLTHDRDGRLSPWLTASYGAPAGAWELAATAEIGSYNDPNVGARARTDAAGAPTLLESERRDNRFDKWASSLEAKRSAFGGDLAVNARLSGDAFETVTLRTGFAGGAPDAAPAQTRIVRFAEDTRDGEVSLAFARPIAEAWRMEALTLAAWEERLETASSLVDAPVGVFSSGARSRSDRTSLEWIARATIKPPELGGWRPEFGGEIAYNRVDAGLEFVTLAPGGVAIPVVLPAAAVVVDEWRSQAFATLSRALAATWTVDAGLGVESSRIAVTGGAQRSQSVSLIKPSLALAWKPSETLTLRGAVRREAGQLDFDAFAASAEVGTDLSFGGNPALRPDTATRATVDIDYRAAGGLAMTVEAFHEWRDDVLEPIILPSGDFGEGNAGSARVWGLGVRASGTLPWGLRGDLRASWRDSSFFDPISGKDRPINGFTPLTYAAEMRQDLKEAGLAWGVRFSKEGVVSSYFVTEEQSFDRGFERSVYVERNINQQIKATLTVSEPEPREFRQERTFFSPTRAGASAGREERVFERGPDVTLRLEGSF